jgi:pilus assembly protein CpaB
MRNKRILLVLLIAVTAGVVAVLLASKFITQSSEKNEIRIAVASTDISLGQRVTPDLVRLVEWPAGSMPPGAFDTLAALEGRVVKTGVLRGEPLSEAKLAPIGTTGGLSAVIAEGRRAITVRVNDVIGVAGFALPGNYVDIIVSMQKDGERSGKDQNISKIVLERILVLAVAQEVSRDDTKPRVVNAVTLEVTPEQAEKLDLARSVGSLSLALRNQVDPGPGITQGATKSTLLDEKNNDTPQLTENKSTSKPQRATKKIVTANRDKQVASESESNRVNINCVAVINGLRNSQECY